MSELTAERIPVAVSLRVLTLSRAPYYRWRTQQITNAELVEAHRTNALFDVHRDDGLGHRLLPDEAADAGQGMCRRAAWRICHDNQWFCAFGTKRAENGERPAKPCMRTSSNGTSPPTTSTNCG